MSRRKEIEGKLSEVKFPKLPQDDREFYNYTTWLSLKRKGAPDQLSTISEALNALIHEQGLTLSKHDKG